MCSGDRVTVCAAARANVGGVPTQNLRGVCTGDGTAPCIDASDSEEDSSVIYDSEEELLVVECWACKSYQCIYFSGNGNGMCLKGMLLHAWECFKFYLVMHLVVVCNALSSIRSHFSLKRALFLCFYL